MSLIIKDGIKYASGTNLVELTQSQYDQLTSAQKNNGNFYLISDAPCSAYDLGNLNDVNISSLSTGQVLAYNGTNWINSNAVINLNTAVSQFSSWTTSTTSFTAACDSIGIYSAIGASLDNLKTNIVSYTGGTINNRVDTTQGPNYFMIFGVANANYFTGILLSYFYNDPSRQPVMFTYSNGTYAVKKI